ncbi:hypothetical protein CGCVW01_v013600 [Colletotrichum viniferum]|nr:hypothetical protein CGCVW01_v013600 [Colletotrichum viniferum]
MHSTSQALPRQTLTTTTTTTTTTTIPQPSPTHQHHQHRVSHLHSHSATQPWQLHPVTAPYHSVHQSLSPQIKDKSRHEQTRHHTRGAHEPPEHSHSKTLGQPFPRFSYLLRRLTKPSRRISHTSFAPSTVLLFPAFHRHHTIRRTAPHLTRATGGIAEPSQGGGGDHQHHRCPAAADADHDIHLASTIHGQDRTGQAAPVQLEQASIHPSHRIHRHPSSPPCLRTYL